MYYSYLVTFPEHGPFEYLLEFLFAGIPVIRRAFLISSSTSEFQWIGSLQKKYSIGSFELLGKTAPIQATSLLVFGPFIDYYLTGKLISAYKMTAGAMVGVSQALL